MGAEHTRSDLDFLAGGGEMGKLIREKDWSGSVVGEPGTWPQSLRTVLSLILHSKFPMFLWWGKELTCFYNDAYRPSLGKSGRHPEILGAGAEEGWADIWPVIKPLIDQVLEGGEATWSEDQLIPIYRNGKLEDVYWTFSYSPVRDETGSVAGVLVTCFETTGTVVTLKALTDGKEELDFTLNAAELGTWDLNPFTNRFRGNDRLKNWFGLKPEDEIELSLALSCIHEKDRENVIKAISDALDPATGGYYDIEYTIINPAENRERIVVAKGKAVFRDGVAYRFSGTLQDITETVMARRKLEASEKEFRQLADSLPSMVWTTDAAGKQTFASARWKEYTGLDPYDELTFAKMVHPDDLADIISVWNESLSQGSNYRTVARLRGHNGNYEWFEVNGKPLTDSSGRVNKWVGTFTNIHEQKRAEERLIGALHKIEESEKRFRNVADQAPVLIWMAGTDKRCYFFNKAWLEFTGRTMEQEAGNGWVEGVHPDDLDRCMEIYVISFDKREPFYMEYRLKRNDGQYRWISDKAVPRFTADGIFEGYIGACMDIDDKILAENRKQANEEKLNMVIDASELGMWELDLVKGELHFSDRYLAIFGITDRARITHPEFVKYIHPDDLSLREEAFKRAMETGVLQYEARLIWKDGSVHWIEAKGKVFYDEAGKPLNMIGTIRDIQEQKMFSSELEKQVQHRTRELNKLNEELQSFAYVSSHDLQEPLRKIQTFAARIMEKESDRLSDTGRDYFLRMRDAANRMQKLIEDLLVYSRTNSGEGAMEKTSLSKVLKEVKNELRENILEKDAVIEAGDLGEISIIPFQFRQLFTNMIGNSLKFARTGEPLRITITSGSVKGSDVPGEAISENYYHLRFSDNGIGFDPKYADRIFEVFQRLHGKSEYKGTGIGLSIVKKIVENHNGVIRATGRENEGAVFDIYLPVQEES